MRFGLVGLGVIAFKHNSCYEGEKTILAQQSLMAVVEIYTDGAARGNPGPGGYGTILKFGAHEKELSGGFRKTTNNRMELLAVIKGLEALTRDGLDVKIFSDSKYVVDSVEKRWVFGWERIGFKKKKNADLWRQFLPLFRKHNVRFYWIRGHNDHPYNERCDVLATTAADGRNLLVDEEFERNEQSIFEDD